MAHPNPLLKVLWRRELRLRHAHRSRQTPFSDAAYDDVAVAIRRWYVGRRLSEALTSFFQTARSRVSIVVLSPQG